MSKEPRITELKETINLMLSDNWQDRFRAEYFQLKLRYDKLEETVALCLSGAIKMPKHQLSEYYEQLAVMSQYMSILQSRAFAEGIEIYSVREVQEKCYNDEKTEN